MQSKKKKIVFGVLLLLVGAILILTYVVLFTPCNNLSVQKPAYIYIYSNKPIEESFNTVKNNQILKHVDGLILFAKLTGNFNKIKPGRYAVDESCTNLKLLLRLTEGRQTPLNVTLLHAQRIPDVVALFSQKLEVDSALLLKALQDSAYLSKRGFTTQNVMALFIPNTYNFYWTTDVKQLFERMEIEYNKFWDLTKRNKADSLQLTPIEVAILASIVQKETNKVDEMPVIAGTYLNRLKIGMPLQADPTLIFALNNSQIKRVGGSMLKIQSPYNTYINKGLPPGPISMPTVQATLAVLNAAQHNYLYFCARSDFSGYHAFASNYSTHQINARAYQKALNRKGIK